jgi:hypothetical protein
MEDQNKPTLDDTIKSNQSTASVIPSKEFMYVPIEELFNTPEDERFANTSDPATLQNLNAFAPSINKYAITANANMVNPNPGLATDTYDPVKQQNPAQSWVDKIDNIKKYDAGPGVNRADTVYSGIKAQNFMRFFEHPEFANVGFVPYSNIDASYNANSTVWDDMARMRGQFGSLVGSGFKSVYRNIGDPLSPDMKTAGEFEDAMAIGNSSRGGAMAWTNNLLLNSGYTFGIIGSIAVEELALTLGSAAVAATGVGAVPAAGAWTLGTANIMRKLSNVFTGTKLFKGTRNLTKAASNTAASRKIWEGTQGLGTVGNLMFDFIAPETMAAIRSLRTAKNGTQNIFNMGKGSSLFGGFYRDLRAVNYALAESRLEAGMVYNTTLNNVMNLKADEEFGAGITDSGVSKAQSAAAGAAFYTTLGNAPLIYLSNKFVLGNALGGFNRTLGRVFNDSYKGVGRRLIKSKSTFGTGAGKKILNKNVFSDAGKGFTGWLNKVKAGGIKGNAGMAAGATLRYFAANVAEGGQEIGQEAISAATTGYFTAINRDTMMGGVEIQNTMINSAIGDIFTAQGFDVFMSGFLMGGVVQGPQKLFFQGVPALYQKYSDPTAYAEQKEHEESFVKKLVEVHNKSWNSQIADPKQLFDPTKFNFIIQKQIADGMKESSYKDDMFGFKNKQDFAKFQQLYTLFKQGSASIFQDQLNDYLSLTDEELAEAFPSTKKDIKNGKLRYRLQKMITQIGETETTYEQSKDRFQNPFDSSQFTKGSREYITEVLSEAGYEHARYLYLFTQDSFNQAIKRADSIYTNLSNESLFKNMKASDLTVLLDPASITKELDMLLMEINNQDVKKDENGNIIRDRNGLPIGSNATAKAEIKKKYERTKRLQAIYDIITDPKNATKLEGKRQGTFDRTKIEKLRKEFLNYMRFMASSSDSFLDTSKVDEALKMIVDYIALGGTAKTYDKAIEYLQNPARFQEIVNRSFEFNKQAYKNIQKNFKSLVKNYIGIVKANELVNQLASLDPAIYADLEQTKIFLQTGNVNVLTKFYSPDGEVTPLQDPVTWGLIQQKLSVYRKDTQAESTVPETKEEKQAAVLAEENKTKQDEVLEEVGIDVIIENESNSPMLEELLLRQYRKYEAEQLVAGQSKISWEEWKNTEEGLNYKNTFNAIKKIWATETEISNEALQAETGLADWLLSREARESDLIGKVLGISNLPYSEIINSDSVSEVAINKTGKKNTEVLASGSTVNIIKITDPGASAFYMISDKFGNPLSSTLRLVVDPNNKNPESIYTTRAAANKVFDQLEKLAPDSTTFTFGQLELNQGSSLFDKITGQEFIVVSTPASILRGNLELVLKTDINQGINNAPRVSFTEEKVNNKFIQKALDLTQFTKDVSRMTIEDLLSFYPHHNKSDRSNNNYDPGKERLKLILSVLSPEEVEGLQLVISKNTKQESRGNFSVPGKEINPSIQVQTEEYSIGLRTTNTNALSKIAKILKDSNIDPVDNANGVFGYLPNKTFVFKNSNGVVLENQVNLTYDQLFNTVDLSKAKGIEKDKLADYYAKIFSISQLLSQAVEKNIGPNITAKNPLFMNLSELPFGMSLVMEGVQLDFMKGLQNSFNSLQYNTSDNSGGLLIYDLQDGTAIASTNLTGDLEIKLIKDVKAGLKNQKLWEQMIADSKQKTIAGSREKSDRYKAAVLLPNGQYALIPLKSRSYTQEQLSAIAVKLITQAQETQKDGKYPKNFNIELENSLFISFAEGYDVELKVDKFGKIQLQKYNKKTNEKSYYELDQSEVNEAKSASVKLSILIDKFNNDDANKSILYKGNRVLLSAKNFRESLPKNTNVNTVINNTTTTVAINVIKPQAILLTANSELVNQAMQLNAVLNRPDSNIEENIVEKSVIAIGINQLSDPDFNDYKSQNFQELPSKYIQEIVSKKIADPNVVLTDREAEIEKARFAEITLLVNAEVNQSINTTEVSSESSLSEVISKIDKRREVVLQDVAFQNEAAALEQDVEYQNLLALRKKLDKGRDANKILPVNLSEQDVEDIDVFTNWADTTLPSFISIADIDTLGNNLKDGGVRVGAFVLGLNHIAGGQNVSGTIYTGANSPFKYHEAFHGVFRMLLTDEEINNYRGIARKEVRAKLRAEGKNFKQELERFRNSADTYANMTEAELQNEYYEEYLADEFEKFKISPKNTNTQASVKSLFTRILEWIQAVFGAKTELNAIDYLFDYIDSGNFKGASLIKNQFTSPLQVGVASEANALVPYAEIQQGNRKGKLYLNNDIAGQLINGMAAHYIQRERAAAKEGMFNPRDILNTVLNDFRNLYHPSNPINENKSDLQKARLDEILFAFNRFPDVIEDQVLEYLNIINGQLTDSEYNEEYFEDQTGLRTTSQYDLDATNIGGINSIPAFLRAYLATTTLTEQDYFGNTILVEGEQLIVPVDFNNAYNGILKAVKNIDDPVNLLKSLYLFGQSNVNSGAVVDRIMLDVFGEINPQKILDGSALSSPIKNPILFQQITNGFSNFRVEYIFNEVDAQGNLLVYSAAERDDINSQMDRWSQAFLYKRRRLISDENRKDLAVDKLQELYSGISINNESVSDQILDSKSKMLAEDIFELIGLKFSPLYIKYNLIIAKDESAMTPAQKALIDLNQDAERFVLDDVEQLIRQIGRGVDIFDTGKVDGMNSRLKQMAINNAMFDETIGASVFRNANGDLVYAHQKGTYHLRAVESLNSSSTIKEKLNNPYLETNFLLNDPAFLALSAKNKLKVVRVAGLKIKDQITDNDISNLSSVISTDTYGDFSPKKFLATLLNNYTANVNTKSNKVNTVEYLDKDGNVQEKAISPVLIRVQEASNTGDLIGLGVIKTVEIVGNNVKITEEAVDIFIENIRNEFNRISREYAQGVEFGLEVEGYHNGAGRAYKFNNNSILLDSVTKEKLQVAAKNKGLDNNLITLEEALKSTSVSMTELRAEVVKNLEIQYDEFKEIITDLGVQQLLSKKVKQGLIMAEGFSTTALQESNDLLNLTNNLENNLKQIFFNDYINTIAINDILLGDQAVSLKDAVDRIKRAKMQNAAFYNAYSAISAPEVGVLHNNEKISLVTFAEPKGISQFSDNAVDKADAQMYITTKAFRYMWFGMGLLKEEQVNLLDKLEAGIAITSDSVYGVDNKVGLAKQQALINSKKLVYADGTTFLKMSAFVLTKEYTSNWNGEAWVAKPNRTTLHNLRVKLEAKEALEDTIAIAAPLSAVKMQKQRVVELNSFDNELPLSTNEFSDLDARYMGLQVVSPSNKTEIVDPSQIKEIITSEQTDEVKIPGMLDADGDVMTVGDVRREYNKAISQRVLLKFKNKRNIVFDFNTAMSEFELSKIQGAITPKLSAFLRYATAGLKSSQASSNLLEFFSDENGVSYNLNNSITVRKAEQLFLAYFSRGVLAERTPGVTLTLVSDFGNNVYRRVYEFDEKGLPLRSEIIRVKQWEAMTTKPFLTSSTNSTDLSKQDNWLGTDMPKEGVVILDRLRSGLTEYTNPKDKNTATGLRYTEMMMPAMDKNIMDFIENNPNSKIADVVSKMFGVRIPSQDKHSSVNMKLVDFMPVYYGSSAMFAQEIIETSGADFDIDKVFAQIKEYYLKNNEFIEYGTETSLDQSYNAYINYINETIKKPGSIYAEALELFTDDAVRPEHQIDDFTLDIITFPDGPVTEESRKALMMLGLPLTKSQYKTYKEKYGEPYEAPYNNNVLNYRYALAGNEGMTGGTNPIAYSPANDKIITTTLSNLAGLESQQKNGNNVFTNRMLEDNVDVDNLLGKTKAFKANKGASIGSVVLPNLYLSLLTEYKVDVKFDFLNAREFLTKKEGKVVFNTFSFNGKPYDTFKNTTEESGQRKQDTISALISIAVDNAKDRNISKLGLSKPAMSIITNMIALGVPLQTAVLFINTPAVQSIFNSVIENGGSIGSLVKIKLNNGQYAKLKPIEKLTDSTMLDDINGTLEGDKKDVDKAILLRLGTIAKLVTITSKMGAITGLTKGLGSSLIELQDKLNTYNELKKNDLIDVSEIYTKGWQGTYVAVIEQMLEKLLPSVFISATPKFKSLMSQTVDLFDVPVSTERTRILNGISSNILSYLTIKAYQKNLLDNNGQVAATLQNSFIYPQPLVDGQQIKSIVDVIDDLKGTEAGQDNFFLEEFVIATPASDLSNTTGINLAEANTFRNLSDSQKIDLQTSFAKLYNSLETRNDADAIINYIMVKDGLELRYASLLEAISPYTLAPYLNQINNVQQTFNGLVSFESTYGITEQELTKEFLSNYPIASGMNSLLKTFMQGEGQALPKAYSFQQGKLKFTYESDAVEEQVLRIGNIDDAGSIKYFTYVANQGMADSQSGDVTYVLTKPVGSRSQTPIGFMFGPSATLQSIDNNVVVTQPAPQTSEVANKLKIISERRAIATKSDLQNSQLIKDIRVDKTQPNALTPNAVDNKLAAIMLYGKTYDALIEEGLPEEANEAKTLAYRILNDLMFDINEIEEYMDVMTPEYAGVLTTNENPVKEFFENDIFELVDNQLAQQTSEVVPADSLDDDNTGFNVVEAALKSETSIVEANEKETTIRAAGPQSDPVNIANKAKLLEQLSLNFEVVEQDQNSAQALNATDQDLKPSDPTNEKSLVNEQTKFIFEEDITEQYPDLANEYDRLMKNKNNYPVMVAEKLFPVEVMIEQYEEMKKINVNLTEEDFKEHLKCLGIK